MNRIPETDSLNNPVDDMTDFVGGDWNSWTPRAAGPGWVIHNNVVDEWYAVHLANQPWPNASGPMLGKEYPVVQGKTYSFTVKITVPYIPQGRRELYLSVQGERAPSFSLEPLESQVLTYNFVAKSNSADFIVNSALPSFERRSFSINFIKV